jgi:hypothetical protein
LDIDMDAEFFIFVCHVTEDREAALRVVSELEHRGTKCWIAPRDVRPGRPFDDEIADAIDSSRAMLLIFSDRCNERDYIRREVTVAGEAGKPIIPFRIENALPKRGLRVRLSDLHWIDAFVEREKAIDEVIREVGRADEPAPPAAKANEGEKEKPTAEQQRKDAVAEAERPREVRQVSEALPPAGRPKDALAAAERLQVVRQAPVALQTEPGAKRETENRNEPHPGVKTATRRRVVLGLSGAAGLAVVGGVIWTRQFQLQPPSQLASEPEPPSQPPSPSQPPPPVEHLIRSFAGDSGEIKCVRLSPDARAALSAGDKLKLWDVTTGNELRTYETEFATVYSVAFSPDGRTALAGGQGWLRLWDVASGKLLREFADSYDEGRSVAFSADGRTALTGGDRAVRLWDIATGKQRRTFTDDASYVGSVAFSPDGRTVLAGDLRGIKQWDVQTGKQLSAFEVTTGQDGVHSIAFLPDGRSALVGGLNAHLLDLATGKQIRQFNSYSYISSVALSPDGRTFLCGMGGFELELWNVATGDKIRDINSGVNVRSVAFSRDGRTALTSTWEAVGGAKLKLWDLTES